MLGGAPRGFPQIPDRDLAIPPERLKLTPKLRCSPRQGPISWFAAQYVIIMVSALHLYIYNSIGNMQYVPCRRFLADHHGTAVPRCTRCAVEESQMDP